MKSLNVTFCAASVAALFVAVPSSAMAHARAYAPVPVDFSSTETTTVNMEQLDGVKLLLPEGVKPTATIENEYLATCDVLTIKPKAKGWTVKVAFSAELDDGINSCDVVTTQGTKAERVQLSLFVSN
jgi:methionine-rich copper-binding protein CopC